MSSTRSPSRAAPATEPRRWSVARLAALLYPFAAGAVAINLFMAGLIGPALGMATLSPLAALAGGAALGVPAAWAAGRWVRRLLDEAR